MRKSEIERLQFLRAKLDRGEALTEKETERFNSLSLQARQERVNGGNINGRIDTNPSGGNHTSVPANPGTSSGAIGNETGESPIADGGIGTGTISDVAGIDSGTDSGNGSDTESGGRDRNNDGGSSTEDRSIDETDGGNQGSDTASGGGKPSGGKTARISNKENTGLADLKPRDVTPKRTKTSKGDTSKKATGGDTTTDTLAALFVAGFGMFAAVTGRDHWSITEREGEKIAAPMETMLANLPAKTKKIIEKYTAPAIFGAALAEVIIPRAMIDITAMKGNRNNERNQRPIGSSSASDFITDDSVHTEGRNIPAAASAVPAVSPAIAGLFDQSNI